VALSTPLDNALRVLDGGVLRIADVRIGPVVGPALMPQPGSQVELSGVVLVQNRQH
jgi:hypothetical protein